MLELAKCRDGISRNYDTTLQLFNEARYRVWVVWFAVQLSEIQPKFNSEALADFPKSKFWDEGLVPYNKDGRIVQQSGLLLKKGAKPSDAIREFFTPAGAALKVDCASFVMIVYRRAWLQILPDAEYN